MAQRRGRPPVAPKRNPETAAELAPILRRHAIKLLDRGNGAAADWPLIAEAALKVAFDALDLSPNDPRTHRLLRRVHSGAENRITQHPAYEREAFEASSTLTQSAPGQGMPAYAPDGPERTPG